MPELEVWRCGSCGGDVQIDAVDRAGIYRCNFCGATLSAPSAAGALCEVRLEDPGPTKIGVVKVIAEYSTLGTALGLVKSAPVVVRSNVSQQEAEQLRQRLVAAGASVTVVQMGGGAPAAQVRSPAVADPLVLGGMWYTGTELEVRNPADHAVLGRVEVTSSTFELAIPTGGKPLVAYLAIRRDPDLPMVVCFNHGLSQSRGLGDPLPPPRQLYEAFARLAGVAIEPGKGIVSLRARRDEVNPDRTGVSFTLSAPDLAVTYVDERGGVTAGLQQTSEHGCALVFNVPPGPISVTATHAGETWAPASAYVSPDIVTELQMWR